MQFTLLTAILASLAAPPSTQPAAWALDEKPAVPGEWGYRPAEGFVSLVNPPGFVWRPQSRAVRYELQVARDSAFKRRAYEARDVELYCHCPPRTLAPGTWHWRFRGIDKAGVPSVWSTARKFTIADDAVEMPLPRRGELRERIPDAHPRLFVRPEDLPRLRELARSELSNEYKVLVRRCDTLLRKPPPTDEPRKYPEGMENKSEEWKELWWGNRVYTIAVLDSAATLAFTRLLDGNEKYGELAKRLLMGAARWDPKGATGFRYNDEAGMPYAYFFSRTYTFVHDLLSEEERRICREVMRVRGQEMRDHLRMHIWRPYGSHSNRAWHFLGEVGIAFTGEIPEAEEWMWFAMNVFQNAYPVWSDADGGWHEGLAYWRSYISRFTWWADVMRSAFGIDAYRKPYFSQIGYYPMYLQPPGTRGGGFGDLCGRLESAGNVPLMRIFAAQTGNPYWQWYADVHERGGRSDGTYVGFIRGALPQVTAQEPKDLPSSRCFRGIGQAFLNTNLLDGRENVQVLFKSSPFGTQSHGYDASNAFLLTAFGQPLFISSGWRDIYGSAHHAKWMWHTKSTNSITVNGAGQTAHSAAAIARISAFASEPGFDYVAGDAASAYGDKLERFTRRIVFVKPELVVIHDLLEAKEPARFEWWLHAPAPMQINGQRLQVSEGPGACDVTFLHPRDLSITHTDRFDPPPRPSVKLTEYHLTAATPGESSTCEFVTVLQPRRSSAPASGAPRLVKIDAGWAVEADLDQGRAVVLLRNSPGDGLRHAGFAAQGDVGACRVDGTGRITHRFVPLAEPSPPSPANER